MQMELVWPSGLGFQIRIGILTLLPFLAMRMPALTRALISVDFTFFPLLFFCICIGCVLSQSLCLIHGSLFAAKQIVNV